MSTSKKGGETVKLLKRELSHREDEGLTMAELVVAMVVIAVVLMLLIGVQLSAAVTIAQARDRQEATALGNEAMEQMRAIPWNILNKGLASNFLDASGGDPWVDSGNLVVDDLIIPLEVADPGQDQQYATLAWPPLFDNTGSHTQTRQDRTGSSTVYTVRSYVTEGVDGDTASLGIAVIVEWSNRRGENEHTLLISTAFRGSDSGCLDPDTSPYLGACQAFLSSSAASGSLVVTADASEVGGASNPNPAPLPVVHDSSDIYTITMRTSTASAKIDAQQTTDASAFIKYGGTTFDDDDSDTDPANSGDLQGFASYSVAVDDDAATPDEDASATAPYEDNTNSAINSGEVQQEETGWGGIIRTYAESDFLRPTSTKAYYHDSSQCFAQVPVKQPCAVARIDDVDTLWGGSGTLNTWVDGNHVRLTRRLGEDGNSNNYDQAWAVRYLNAGATDPDFGCQSISGAGCVSAGASRTLEPIRIGEIVGKSWQGDASTGIVKIDGNASDGCSAGMTEVVMVQRGQDQQQTDPTFERCGTLSYWNGSSYTNLDLSTASGTYYSAPVSWTNSRFTMDASSAITIDTVTVTEEGTTGCADTCYVSVVGGQINVVTVYTLANVLSGEEWTMTVTTTLNPPNAQATYKAPPT